ncbi:ferrous iron transport protein A [Thermosipho ferrireducens]|uniref:Ferrous iron transport protein A n=1 Tax=Thermosipho ferrireducens TaxID=2571116 RepID=A0ABX7S570_9BACT|nr:FeoA family protein [Thermosipho ferrireducens]QTA37654.1 ferrous iron transport protein A [Thermosipho ferrireducens]
MTLDRVLPGLRVRIVKIRESDVSNRILGIGIIPDVEIEVVRSSPMGDPRLYRVFNKLVTLRNSEAKLIEVEFLSNFVPLAYVSDGKFEVVKLLGGKMFQLKVKRFGITPGTILDITNGEVFINSTKIDLGFGIKEKIIVRRL